MRIKIKKLIDEAILPIYKTSQSCGADIFSCEDREIQPGEIYAVKTGIAVEIPDGYCISIRPRSGLALKYGITVLNSPGTIDSDYRGEIKVILINHGKKPFFIEKGMRIAQMVLHKYEKIEWEEVDNLSDTERGEGGFGHTGERG